MMNIQYPRHRKLSSDGQCTSYGYLSLRPISTRQSISSSVRIDLPANPATLLAIAEALMAIAKKIQAKDLKSEAEFDHHPRNTPLGDMAFRHGHRRFCKKEYPSQSRKGAMSTSIEDSNAWVISRLGTVSNRELVDKMYSRPQVTGAEAGAIISAIRRQLAEKANATKSMKSTNGSTV